MPAALRQTAKIELWLKFPSEVRPENEIDREAARCSLCSAFDALRRTVQAYMSGAWCRIRRVYKAMHAASTG